MKLAKIGGALFAALVLAFAGEPALAQTKIRLEPFVTGVNAPLAMVQMPGENRFLVIEQWGRVRLIDNGKLTSTPFLDIRSRIHKPLHHDFDERGLLGIALHPKFRENGKFYVAYSHHLQFDQALDQMLWYSHSNVVEEYTVSKADRNSADPNSARRIMTTSWPQFNHNGHWIGFGPDGKLYVSMGDGGYANDWGIGHNVTEGNGQDMSTVLGKILRIDVDTRTGAKAYGIPSDNPFANDRNAKPEIWASGLRNPWRCSFDMGGTKQLFCGDVQQNSYEEVSIIGKGQNLGWRKMEATHCFDYQKPDNHPASCDKSGLTPPILEYNNCTAKPDGCRGISVTGGYVYQGKHAAWKGKYIFGDWSKSFAEMDGQIFIATNSGGKWSMEVAEVVGMSGKKPYILAFAQDSAGEVYALTSVTTGPNGSLDTIYRIVPAQ